MKGWFEKTINTQVCLPSLPAGDGCQQPITCSVLRTSIIFFLLFILGLNKPCAHTPMKDI